RDITLVAVTKTRTVDEVNAVVEAGASELGENRVQEFVRKRDFVQGSPRWHIIGPLQTNKVKYLKGYDVLLQSLDRVELAEEIVKRLGAMEVLVQVNISREPQKSGISPQELEPFLNGMTAFPDIKVQGLMCIAENSDESVVARQFQEMRRLFEKAESLGLPNVQAKYLSMGMSGDYELAIREGSNMIRVGTNLFGRRM
ncbi:MAG: YggS family pyridoxal phosphate-dependent enzyme, partial [Bacillota bacterium]|nr:YggS family pyridoxal phosphate-dependent enzyme [Bacillota bacterium]